MRLLGDRVSRRTTWKIAREQGWETTYDAEYLAVTKLQADALVTVNPALAAKARDVVSASTPRSAQRGPRLTGCRTSCGDRRQCSERADWHFRKRMVNGNSCGGGRAAVDRQ